MDKPARWWIATHNNPVVQLSEHFDAIFDAGNMRYIAGQTEIGSEGTKHFQYLVCLSKPQRLSFMKKVDARAHWEVIRRIDAVQKYVSK